MVKVPMRMSMILGLLRTNPPQSPPLRGEAFKPPLRRGGLEGFGFMVLKLLLTHLQRLVNIGNDVAGILDADGEADQIRLDAAGFLLFGR